MRRPATLLFGVLAILLAGSAWAWLQQPPSNQELLANYAKAQDFWMGIKNVAGLPWWTPNFLQGTSLATGWGNALSSLTLLLGASLLGPYAGSKAAALACLLIGAWGMFAFVRRLVDDAWSGVAAALAYTLCPPLLVRLFGYEHYVVVCAMAFLPWAFLGTLQFVRNPSLITALAAAAGLAAVTLAYAKTALLCLPALGGFALAMYIRQPGDRRPSWKALAIAAAALTALAALPNLPGLRETRHLTMFEFAPYEQWQHAFASKSAITWIDRDGLVSEKMAPGFAPTTSQGGNYPGAVILIAFVGVFFFRKDLLTSSPRGSQIRLFTGLALLLHWLSFGPRPVLGGHLEFLRSSMDAPHWTVAVAWFSLVVQVWLIFHLLPATGPLRGWIAGLLSLIYLAVPGFRLVEFLPGFDNLRAPQDFFQVPGAFCVMVAGGIALREIIALAPAHPGRLAWGAAALIGMIADSSPYWRPAYQGPLSRDVFAQFEEAQEFLRSSEKFGYVYPLSGRYFYLLTPHLSGRPLAAEAFNSYLQQRGISLLQGAAGTSAKNTAAYYLAAGISHILIDKNDPDTPQELQEQFSTNTSLVFENEHFAIRETVSPGLAYVAENFLQATATTPFTAISALSYVPYHLATIELTGAATATPGLRGKIGDNAVEFLPGKSSGDATPFVPQAVTPKNLSYQEFSVTLTGQPGWLVVTQAYHPDWTATVDGVKRPTHPAYGGLLAVDTTGVQGTVQFRFVPPAWYSPVIFASLAAWLLAGAVSAGLAFGILPRSWAQALRRPLTLNPPAPAIARDNTPIQRPLVAIPTYCEAELINQVLDRVLAAAPGAEILVIDDASPDGTARQIENRADYGRKTHLLKRAGKLGLGSAYKEAFQWALNHGYDAVLEMDADLSHPPEDVSRLVAALNEGWDAAIGSRYLGGVRVINWPQHRLLLSTWASGYVRWLTGMPLTDPTSGFKAIRTSLLRDMDWRQFRAEGYGFQVELHYFLWRRGARMVEIPIVFTERLGGKTKMNIGIAIEAAARVLQLAVQRPFHAP